MSGIDDLLAEREITHGDFSHVAVLANAIQHTLRCSSGHERLPVEAVVALDMIAVKIARIIAGDAEHADHWQDIAGYATLIARMCEGER